MSKPPLRIPYLDMQRLNGLFAEKTSSWLFICDLNGEWQAPCSFRGKPSVYFLLNKGEIVYVGATRNLINRIKQHIYEKNLDEIRYLITDHYLEWEPFYIRRYLPKYNCHHNPEWRPTFHDITEEEVRAFQWSEI